MSDAARKAKLAADRCDELYRDLYAIERRLWAHFGPRRDSVEAQHFAWLLADHRRMSAASKIADKAYHALAREPTP